MRGVALAAALVHDRGGQEAVDGVQPGGPQSAVIRIMAHQEHERDLGATHNDQEVSGSVYGRSVTLCCLLRSRIQMTTSLRGVRVALCAMPFARQDQNFGFRRET